MIRTRNPKIDVAAIEQRIEEELAREPATGGRHARLAAAVHLRAIDHAIATAEERSQPRVEWPADLQLFPLSASRRLRSAALRFLALAFRDQHEVNAALILSQRELLAINTALLERISDLEARVERERAAARVSRAAARRTDIEVVRPDEPLDG